MNKPNELTRTGNPVYIGDRTCTKCGSRSSVRCGFVRKKQRYQCKICGSRFMKSKTIKQTSYTPMYAVKLYTEGMSIRGIGRILNTSHVTVLKWLKRMAEKLHPPTPTHARYIEIDELYFYVGSKKRKRWLWLAICRDTKRILGFCTGGRGTKTLEKLWHRISPIQCERYYTDKHAPFAKVLPKDKHRNYPNQTNTIEGINSAVRHYLARFRRRSKCYSKSIAMAEASISLLSYKFSKRHENMESLYL